MITIIGCGNLIRKDDGAGPILIRKLWDLGIPPNVRLADGGTAGMDVVFQIGDAKELIIIDACTTGSEPGTVYEIPGEEVEAIPLENINIHNFRWDHAIAMGRWLLKEHFPEKVTVYLIEAEDLSYGSGLTKKVEESVEKLARKLIQKYQVKKLKCQITEEGYLQIPAEIAQRYFSSGAIIAIVQAKDLLIMPVNYVGAGGLILKYRNAKGDRSVLVSEFLPEDVDYGSRSVQWDEEALALRVPLYVNN